MDQNLHTGSDIRECPFIQGIQISIRVRNLFVCIKLEGTCFQVITRKCSFGYDTSIQSGFKIIHRKHEYINVNSKTYIVYSIHRNEREIKMKLKVERGTKLLKAPHRYDLYHTILLYYCAEIERGCVLLIASCGQALIITCTLIIGRICTRHCNLRNKHCLFQASGLYLFTSFTSCGHFFEARLFFGTSRKTYVDTARN